MRFVSGLIGFIRRYSVLFVLVSIFLIKTPPFYLFPPIKSSLLTTHTLSRLFILLAFAGIYWEEIRGKAKPLGQNAKLLLWFFVVYLIFQSLSLVGASNVIGFLQRYKDVVFPGLLLFVVVARRLKREKVVLIFLLAASVNFVYQMIMFFLPSAPPPRRYSPNNETTKVPNYVVYIGLLRSFRIGSYQSRKRPDVYRNVR